MKHEDFLVACPFCREEDFDLPGLEFHLGRCDTAKQQQEAYEAWIRRDRDD